MSMTGGGCRDEGKNGSNSVFYQKYVLAPDISFIWKLHLMKTRIKEAEALNFFRDINEEKLLK